MLTNPLTTLVKHRLHVVVDARVEFVAKYDDQTTHVPTFEMGLTKVMKALIQKSEGYET
jgi:hypothetical protein